MKWLLILAAVICAAIAQRTEDRSLVFALGMVAGIACMTTASLRRPGSPPPAASSPAERAPLGRSPLGTGRLESPAATAPGAPGEGR